MGVVDNISHDQWPIQSDNLGKRVAIIFGYNFEHSFLGTIVRDDRETPYRMIIHLDNGRFVLADECQYQVESTEHG